MMPRGSGSTTLMKRASCLLELPGHSERLLDAYVMTGRATVSHCDLLVAVWDGLPPRGRGGTGEVVQFAITRGTAVVHLPDSNWRSRSRPLERVRPGGPHDRGRGDRRAPSKSGELRSAPAGTADAAARSRMSRTS